MTVELPEFSRESLPSGGGWRECYRVPGAHSFHRTDGPALVTYRADGSVSRDEWYIDGAHHRVDGPAMTRYDEFGEPSTEEWFSGGRKHRIDGPAEIAYRIGSGGEVVTATWFLDDRITAPGPRIEVKLAEWSTPRLRAELGRSSYRVLLDEGWKPRQIAAALGDGVVTVEGIRAVLDGAPIEWARAFETAHT